MILGSVSIPLPDSVERAELRVVCGATISDGDVLVSCTVNTNDQENLDISRWPKYHRNGLPSKFLKETDRGSVRRLTDLYLPRADGRTLSLSLSSEAVHDWSNWTALLFARERDSPFPMLWTLNFGEETK